MKKIFQTGLAFGYENGVCEVCNLNYSWLFNTPSTLLWVDKVVVTKPVWEIITKDYAHEDGVTDKKNNIIVQRTMKMVYEILKSVGMIELVDSNGISEEDKALIYKQVESDIELLSSLDIINDNNDHLFYIGTESYCIPSLWTLYASLLYSRRTMSNFSLEDNELTYLRTLIPIKQGKEVPVSRKASAINNVLEMYLPELRLWPEYMFVKQETCDTCSKLAVCDDKYLNTIEKRLFKLLEQREHDEIIEFCQILDSICEESFKDDYEVDTNDLVRELNVRRVKVQHKLNQVYKKVNTWSKVIGTVSAALSLGFFFDNPEITAIGGLGMFAAEITDKVNNFFHEKYKWVNFINQRVDDKPAE